MPGRWAGSWRRAAPTAPREPRTRTCRRLAPPAARGRVPRGVGVLLVYLSICRGGFKPEQATKRGPGHSTRDRKTEIERKKHVNKKMFGPPAGPGRWAAHPATRGWFLMSLASQTHSQAQTIGRKLSSPPCPRARRASADSAYGLARGTLTLNPKP